MTDCEELYMIQCKHYANGVCTMRSGWSGGFHSCEACTGDCARMKRYRKLKGIDNKPYEITQRLYNRLKELEIEEYYESDT